MVSRVTKSLTACTVQSGLMALMRSAMTSTFGRPTVLSNLFCALLIFTVGPFRLGDYIEVLDTAEKPGAKGRVIDINLLYTTLEDFDTGADSALLQIPNTLIFQRVVRRWKGGPPRRPDAAPQEAATAETSSSLETV